MASSIKSNSYFVLFDYAEADSLCKDCLKKCLRNQDNQVYRECGEVLQYSVNGSGDFARYCDFCEREIKQPELINKVPLLR